MGTNCVPYLADLFLCSYDSECLDGHTLNKWVKELAPSLNLNYR